MPTSVAPPVKASSITAQQTAHSFGDGNIAGFNQKMEMIWDQCPSVALCFALSENLTKAAQEIIAIIIVENLPVLNAASNNVV